jgi:hypothetical protein
MRILAIALLATMTIAYAGCGRWVYHHPEYTPERWARDSYECERDARQSGYFGGGMRGAIEFRNFQDRCLAARGWVKTRESN